MSRHPALEFGTIDTKWVTELGTMTHIRILTSLVFAATIAAIHPALAFEALPDEPLQEAGMQSPPERVVPPEEAPLPRARVVAVDGAAGKITLDYPPIPEIFLEGGRRIFLVKDPATLKGLVKGDKVRFDVERDGRKYVITRLENTN